MKIGIDAHNLEGNRTGVGRYLWNLLREWHKLAGSDPKTSGVRPRQIEFFLYFKNEIPKDVQGLFNVGSLTFYMRNLGVGSNALFKHWALPRAAKKDGVDVLFCPDYVLPFYVGHPRKATSSPRGKRKPHIKTVVTIHDIVYEAKPDEYSWPSVVDKILLKWASKYSAKKADVIFVPSEFTKREIIKYYKINSEKIIVTSLAPDPIFKKIDFSNTNARQYWEDIKAKYGIYDKFILFVGSVFNRRFLPQCIQGFEQFVKNRRDFSPYSLRPSSGETGGGPPEGWQFLIIGENHTSPHQDIRTRINAVNGRFGRNVILWKKHIEDDKELVYMYNKAYATLWLSSYEGFGLPILESMACGTPVITSGRGSLKEVAQDDALYVQAPEDPKEIEEALLYIEKDKKRYGELVRAGILRAEKFSWSKTANGTAQALLELGN